MGTAAAEQAGKSSPAGGEGEGEENMAEDGDDDSPRGAELAAAKERVELVLCAEVAHFWSSNAQRLARSIERLMSLRLASAKLEQRHVVAREPKVVEKVAVDARGARAKPF